MPSAARIPAWCSSSSPCQSPSEERGRRWMLLVRLIPLEHKMRAIFFIFLYQFDKLFPREAGAQKEEELS